MNIAVDSAVKKFDIQKSTLSRTGYKENLSEKADYLDDNFDNYEFPDSNMILVLEKG